MAASWINKLNESDSRLHKEAVLGTALGLANMGDGGAVRLLSLLRACYDPFVTFGVKQVGVTEGIAGADNPWEEFSELLVKLSKRELTGHAARDAIVAISTRFDSVEWNVFCRPIILKDIRAGISEKTINKVCKRTDFEIPVFGCQLATSCDDRPEMKGLKRLEPKLDGVRALFMVEFILNRQPVVTCYSRNGKVFENFDHICRQIEKHADTISRKCKVMGHSMYDGYVLDGEVIGKSFNDLMKQARRKSDVAATDSIFYVFDVLPLDAFREGHWNAQLEKRISTLEEMRPLFDKMDNVDLLPHLMVNLDTAEGRNQFQRYCNDKVNEGFEGVMVKEMKAPYVCKRSTDWMKYKPVHDYDLVVVALEEGTGKNEGRLGALVCEGTDDGKFIHVNVGSGFTDSQRDEFWANQSLVIGQTAVVMADAISKNQDGSHSLRFPRFKTWRDDK
jgi:DNA ligase-1